MKKVPPPVSPSPGHADLPPQVILVSGLDVRVEGPVAGVLVTMEGNTRTGDPAAMAPLLLSLPAAQRLARALDDTVDNYVYSDEDEDEDES